MDFGKISAPAYDHINAKKAAEDRHMKEAGGPRKGSNAMHQVAIMKDPSLRCVVGTDEFKAINGKLDTYKQNVDRFKELSNSTDVDQ